MAILENYTGEEYHDEYANPYAIEIDSPLVDKALRDLVDFDVPFIDKTTNPDICAFGKDLAVYFIDSEHPAALVSRSLEGHVFDKDWGYAPEKTAQEAKSYEDNSYFFLVVDVTDPDQPKPAVSLRVADCIQGGSATIDYYNESFQNNADEIDELKISETDKKLGLWDIVGVMALEDYRDGLSSVWAYHALYAKSIEHGINRWISSIVDSEYRNLSLSGIPFAPIQGVPKVEMYNQKKNESLFFGFYSAEVNEIRTKVSARIADLESRVEDVDKSILKAAIARLALNGSISPDVSKINSAA